MMKLTVLALAAAPLLVSAESANDAWMQQTNLLEKTSGPSAIAVKTSDTDSDFPRWKIHDFELEVLEVA